MRKLTALAAILTIVGLSALYLASQLRTLVSTSEPTPATSVTA